MTRVTRVKTTNISDGMTYAERKVHIEVHAQNDYKPRRGGLVDAQMWANHIERLRLIYRPFPVVRRLGTGSAAPWAGVIVNDTFGITTNGRTRPAVKTEADLFGGDYHYGRGDEESLLASIL